MKGDNSFLTTLLVWGGLGLIAYLIHVYRETKPNQVYVRDDANDIVGRYKQLYSFLIQNENAYLSGVNKSDFTIDIKNKYDRFYFHIKEKSRTLDIIWSIEDILIGNHSLSWSFPKHVNQQKMCLKITVDIDSYRKRVFGDVA